MVVSLIMRSCRPRSFANQTGPRRSEQSGRADLFGAGHWSWGLAGSRGWMAAGLFRFSLPFR
jgi:hypothetical protein